MTDKQQRWKKKARRLKLCVACGKPAINSSHCDYHAAKHREYEKKRYYDKKALDSL